MRHISNKQEFYAMSKKLQLGNRLNQWTFEQFQELILQSSPVLPEIVGVRHVRQAFTNKGTSGLFPRAKAYQYGLETPDRENILYDEGSVHSDLTLQGEVMASERGLELRYSTLQCHQRTLWALDQDLVGTWKTLERHQLPCNWEEWCRLNYAGRNQRIVQYAWGLKASAILQQYFDDMGWNCLNEILACQLGEENSWGDPVKNITWPVVEFACFNKPVGVLGWNSLVWEVRSKY